MQYITSGGEWAYYVGIDLLGSLSIKMRVAADTVMSVIYLLGTQN